MALDHPPCAFAYPFGHADARVRAAVRRAGFLGAVTTRARACHTGVDVFTPPRAGVRNSRRAFLERYVEVLGATGLPMGHSGHPVASLLKSTLPVPVLAAYARRRHHLAR